MLRAASSLSSSSLSSLSLLSSLLLLLLVLLLVLVLVLVRVVVVVVVVLVVVVVVIVVVVVVVAVVVVFVVVGVVVVVVVVVVIVVIAAAAWSCYRCRCYLCSWYFLQTPQNRQIDGFCEPQKAPNRRCFRDFHILGTKIHRKYRCFWLRANAKPRYLRGFEPLLAKITVFTVFCGPGLAKTLVFTQFPACCQKLFLDAKGTKTL